jgi:hypothetical protein
VVCALAAAAFAAPAHFSAQARLGLTTGDQWEPALSADGSGRVYVLYPHYGDVPNCKDCNAPIMLLVVSEDNGKTWQTPRVLLESGTGQFDAQIVVDPADRHTIYTAWLQNKKREVVVGKSVDLGATWTFGIAARSEEELDKPALTVRGQRIFVGFNHEEEVWVASSQDDGRNFTASRVNADARPGWSLLGGATLDPAGNAYVSWSSYFKSTTVRGVVKLYVAKSADAGKTWQTTLLDNSAAGPGCDDEDCAEAYLGAQVSLASDADGTIYALWNSGTKSKGPQQIYFSSSTDGDVWLDRTAVAPPSRSVNHAFPAIVAGAAGDVRIAWMDTRNAGRWNTYYRSSTNGGATWSDEAKVSGYVPGFRYINKNGFRFPFGDYFGIAIDNHNDTHVVWGEGMNYRSPGSIWYANTNK